MKLCSILSLFVVFAASSVFAAGGEAFTNAEDAGPDFKIQGEYAGTFGDKKAGLQVIALGDGEFDAVLLPGGLPGAGWDGKTKIRFKGKTVNGKVRFEGDDTTAGLANGAITGYSGKTGLNLKKVERKSDTLGAKPPKNAVVLFDGSNADAWTNGKVVEDKYLGVGTRTKQKFSDFTLHLEFRTPFMPKSRGQGRGNSGMYLLDQYECQVLDSFGLEGKNNECGGIYSISEPAVNACFPPLSWQTYDVEFTAAKFDAEGKKTTDAVATIKHNGIVIHDKLKLTHSTPGGSQSDEKPPGALFLQNHGNPVHFRNIWIVKK